MRNLINIIKNTLHYTYVYNQVNINEFFLAYTGKCNEKERYDTEVTTRIYLWN